MPPDPPERDLACLGRGEFQTTHWSVVFNARDGKEPQNLAALETLCRAYWLPLYAFVRRQGRNPHDAQDLTQGFFARLIEKNSLASAQPAKGKFRSFLLTVLKHYLADEHDKASAAKRGSGLAPVSLDALKAEEYYRQDPGNDSTPDRLFDRRWALTVVAHARQRLRQVYVEAGKGALFDQLRHYHDQDESIIAYAEAAERLNLPENTVKSHVRRLRRRYREILREEIGRTVSNESEIDDEIRYLLEVITK